jgi:hypothetical protein
MPAIQRPTQSLGGERRLPIRMARAFIPCGQKLGDAGLLDLKIDRASAFLALQHTILVELPSL